MSRELVADHVDVAKASPQPYALSFGWCTKSPHTSRHFRVKQVVHCNARRNTKLQLDSTELDATVKRLASSSKKDSKARKGRHYTSTPNTRPRRPTRRCLRSQRGHSSDCQTTVRADRWRSALFRCIFSRIELRRIRADSAARSCGRQARRGPLALGAVMRPSGDRGTPRPV